MGRKTQVAQQMRFGEIMNREGVCFFFFFLCIFVYLIVAINTNYLYDFVKQNLIKHMYKFPGVPGSNIHKFSEIKQHKCIL